MVSTKEVKQQALKAYKFDIGRNAGVEFISFIVKFALSFTLVTIYIICLAKMGSGAVSPLFTTVFTVLGILLYLFAVAPINLGRNLYFAKVANKTQPETDEMFHFYSNMKFALYAYFRIALEMVFYTLLFTAITIVYFKVFWAMSGNLFSFLNFLICAAIIVLYALSIIIIRMKY